MPRNTKSAVRCSGRQPLACSALVALACLALASCGRGPGAVHPDLVVEDPAVSAPRPAAGASFTFSATVRNAGDGDAAATTLSVYRSEDATVTMADQEVGAATVAELGASASKVATVTVTAASSPGTYYYVACVDPVAGESDTANNCSATVRVVVAAQDTEPPPPQPDLVVEDPTVSDDGPAAGASFTFSATVRNAGDGDAAATTLSVYRSEDATVTTADQEVGAATVAELAASQSMVASVELSAPSSSGTYYYGACVHPVAEESDTANNCSAAVPVTVHAPQVRAPGVPRVDLIAFGAWVDNANPAIGGVFELGVKVRNGGTPVELKTTLRYYRSTDETIEPSDTQLTTRRRWLDTDQYNQEVFDYVSLKAPSSKGTYYYGACVDAVAGESDTTNNCSAAVMVELSHNKPDLGVSSWAIFGTWSTGELEEATTDVWNVGGPAEATTLRLFLLPDGTNAPSTRTQLGEVDVPKLVVTHNRRAYSWRKVEFRAPATAGWYDFVMCVDAVPHESNTANNCSTVAEVNVR